MAARKSTTEWKASCLKRRQVSFAKKPSTALTCAKSLPSGRSMVDAAADKEIDAFEFELGKGCPDLPELENTPSPRDFLTYHNGMLW